MKKLSSLRPARILGFAGLAGFALGIVFAAQALAEPAADSAPAAGEPAGDAAPAPADAPESAPVTSKGKRIREKEAEGSQAPNRFDGDPVIKSKYELNGQPLEVDPD